ncbi:MAG: GGDEF domain-containing protein [Pseudomonadales bacterium]|nr:GGDEF domain-containing protein [Pseudomonadales bacterium]
MQGSKYLRLISYTLVFSFFLITSLLCIFALNELKNNNLNQIRATLQTILTTVQDAQTIWIDQRSQDVRSLASRQDIVTLTQQLIKQHSAASLDTDKTALMQLRALIKPELAKYGDLGFFIIATDRINIASLRDENLAVINLIQEKESALLNRSFQGHSVFIPPIKSDVPLTSQSSLAYPPTLFITTPIRSKQGTVIAVLALRISPDKQFTRITQLGRLGNTGETYAFNHHGMMITASRFEKELRRDQRLKTGQSSILNIRVKNPVTNTEHDQLTVMAESALKEQSDVNTEGYYDYRGVNVFGAWTWDKNNHFGLAIEIDVEEALAPYYQTRRILLFMVFMTAILGLILRIIFHRVQKNTQKRLKEAYNSLDSRVKARTQELENAQLELASTNEKLQSLAITDALTGLNNRRHFDDCLENEWKRCSRKQKQVAIILFDIDFFKPYNDMYGHQKGDECLSRIGALLKEMHIANRPGDCIARYGGEEFVIILSDATQSHANNIAENIRQKISDMHIPHKGSHINHIDWVTTSVGVAIEEAKSSNSREQLLNHADNALYAAKADGRNKVCTFQVQKQKIGNLMQLISTGKKDTR